MRGRWSRAGRGRPGRAAASRSCCDEAVGPLLDPRRVHGDGRRPHGRRSTPEQAENAALIAAIAVSRGLPGPGRDDRARDGVPGVEAAQPRGRRPRLARPVPAAARRRAGAPREQILDPYYATNAFYDALVEGRRLRDDGDHRGRAGGAALGFPEAYADHEEDARALASALTGNSPARVQLPARRRARRGADQADGVRADRARRRRPRRRSDARSATCRSAASRRAASRPATWRARRTTRAGRSTSSSGRSTPDEQAAGAGRSRTTWSARPTGSTSRRHLRRPDLDRRRRSDDGWRDYDPPASGPATAAILEHRDHVHVDVLRADRRTGGLRPREAAAGRPAAATRSSVAVSATRTCRAPGGAVEVAGRDQDAALGEPRRRCPSSRLVAGRPQVERRLGVVDPEAGRLERRAQHAAAGGVPRRAARRRARRRRARRHRGLLRGRAPSARGSCAPRAARRPAPGRRRRTPHGSPPGWTASTASAPRGSPSGEPPQTSGCSTETGSALPGALEVALVGDQRPRRARGTSRRPCAGARPAAPGRSGWPAS